MFSCYCQYTESQRCWSCNKHTVWPFLGFLKCRTVIGVCVWCKPFEPKRCSLPRQLSCYKETYILVSCSSWVVLFCCFFLYGNLSSSFLLSILSYLCLFRPTLSPSVSLFFFTLACTHFFHYLSFALAVYLSLCHSHTFLPSVPLFFLVEHTITRFVSYSTVRGSLCLFLSSSVRLSPFLWVFVSLCPCENTLWAPECL